jgi:predicted O-linked N-acetylglucosamine transferase (SPINDLY family)/predicted SAM-dependent methyltransferase
MTLLREGLRHHQAGRLSQAERRYLRILSMEPGHADSWHQLAIMANQLGKHDIAVGMLNKAIAINGAVALYRSNLGNVLADLGRVGEAVGAYQAAICIKPDYGEARSNLSAALRGLGQLEEAILACKIALCLKPELAEAYSNLSVALMDLGRLDEAVAAFAAALRVKPDYAEAHSNLGNALRELGHLGDAMAACKAALSIAPNYPSAYSNFGVALTEFGRFDDSVAAFTRALRINPDYAEAHSSLLMSLYYRPDVTGDMILVEARRFAAQFERHSEPIFFDNSRDLDRRLRIGYVSGDFRRHPVGYFLAAVLLHHRRTAIEVFCYTNSAKADDVTDHLRGAADHWRSLVGLSDEAAAKLVGADRIDILIDLSGHTGLNRLPLFARKPAPIQASWLGYWGTTGLSAMDYILTDTVTVPPSEEHWYSEQVLRLPDGRFCYAPPEYAPPQAEPPLRRVGYVTFGSFNNLAKIGPEVVRIWAAVLRAVVGSRLLIKWKSLDDDRVRWTLMAAFAAEGIEAERLLLRGASPHPEMLAEYGDVDIALDPFPFSGGLTSCEALWMGVPVITLPTGGVPSRQTLGFLRCLGLNECVAADPDDYVRIAAGLAADGERVAEYRRALRSRMAASPLCDGAGFAQSLEAAYRTMWRNWCDSARICSSQSHKEARVPNRKSLLNVGAGPRHSSALPPAFQGPGWEEIRLDIDPANDPDILGSMHDMPMVAGSSIDAIYSSHTIEHLYPDEVPTAIAEMLRVLKPDGFAVITCPDLQAAARMIAEDRLMDVVYDSPLGPVTPFDMVFSHRMFTGRDKPYMSHHCGFTLKVLMGTLRENGFASVAGKGLSFALWVVATRLPLSDGEIRALAARVLPA